MDLDETNQITFSGLKGVASLDQAQELQETWSRAPAGGEGGGGEGQSGTVLEYAKAVLKIHSWSGALGQLVLRIQLGQTMYAGLGSGYSFSFVVTNMGVEQEGNTLMVELSGITCGQALPIFGAPGHRAPLFVRLWQALSSWQDRSPSNSSVTVNLKSLSLSLSRALSLSRTHAQYN